MSAAAALPELLGLTVSEAIAFSVGLAMGPALHPIVQDLTNETWHLHQSKPLNPELMARLVAEGRPTSSDPAAEATLSGIKGQRFDDLVQLSRQYPGLGELVRLIHRDAINSGDFHGALRRNGFSDTWADYLAKLIPVYLDPAVVAVAVQRTVLPNPGILPNQPSTAGSNVPPMPQVDLDPFAEAKTFGIDAERLKVMARIVGLPASPDLAARMHFRKLITEGAYNQAILEGNTRGEWAPFLLDGFREIPTAHDGVELHLRGWTDPNGMYAQTARHGMSQADTDILFKITGRPISFHQVFIGERRGGVYDGPTDAIDPAFLKSLRESNIRPEWYNLAWAQRHSYPSAFVLRALTQAGDLTQAESKDILLFIGWPESLADKVSKRWAGTSGAPADPNVRKAETQLWTTTHRSFIATESGDAEATARFNLLGIPAAAQTRILELWASERGLIRAQLSPADIRKAYQQGDVNAATGTAWTHDDAIAAFLDRGWSMTDAESYLVIPYKG